MKTLKKYSNLFEFEPDLVKEWHPTANVGLTPRSVKMDYSQKIWWLCNEGHEWQATIESRLRRNVCPICEKEAVKKKSDLPVALSGFGNNYRKNRRFKTKTTAAIEIPKSGHWIYAGMIDFSSHGLCFETDAAIQPGIAVRIIFDKSFVSSRLDKSVKSLFKDGYKTYNAKVKWSKPLDNDKSISNYVTGVELS